MLDDAPTMHEAIPGSVDAQEMPDEGRIKGQAGGLLEVRDLVWQTQSVETPPLTYGCLMPIIAGDSLGSIPGHNLPHRKHCARLFEEATDGFSGVAEAMIKYPMLKALLCLFKGPQIRAVEGQTDTGTWQLQVFLGETRGGVQSEGRKIDRSLQGSLKLAKKYAKVNVEAEVVRRHWRAFWDMRTQPERDTLPGHGAGYRSTITRA